MTGLMDPRQNDDLRTLLILQLDCLEDPEHHAKDALESIVKAHLLVHKWEARILLGVFKASNTDAFSAVES